MACELISVFQIGFLQATKKPNLYYMHDDMQTKIILGFANVLILHVLVADI